MAEQHWQHWQLHATRNSIADAQKVLPAFGLVIFAPSLAEKLENCKLKIPTDAFGFSLVSQLQLQFSWLLIK